MNSDRDREYIAELSRQERMELAEWLKNPSGGLRLGDRVTVESVVGGGILIRTQPYRYRRKVLP